MPVTYRAVTVALATALASVVLAPSAPVAATPVTPVVEQTAKSSFESLEAEVLAEVNAARADESLKPIKLASPCVSRLAEKWSARIARTGVLEHRSQSVVIRRCRQSWAGETLIRGYDLTAESMVAAWMDSPGHRAILMSPKARLGAVAVSVDSDDRVIGVINVVRPSRR